MVLLHSIGVTDMFDARFDVIWILEYIYKPKKKFVQNEIQQRCASDDYIMPLVIFKKGINLVY